MYLACIKFINSVRSFFNHPFIVSNGPPDQDSFIAMALTHAGRHLCGTPLSSLLVQHPPYRPPQVKTWDKVNSGLTKMYLAEVLGKLPVMQHFLFGSLLAWDGPLPALPAGSPGQNDEHWGHAHAMGDLGGVGQRENGWGDCCGIPVPSVFAAAKAEEVRKRVEGGLLSGPGIRPVPFD